MTILKVELAPKLIPLFAKPRGSLRFRVMRGGRGSGKSFTAAKMAAIWGCIDTMRILCVREFQNSIKESFHAELKNAIRSDAWLSSEYDVGVDFIRHKSNGTEFIFRGLRSNIEGVKSMAQVDLVICEESETIPARSWEDLIPTIRTKNSEFWIIYNPRRRDSWVAKTFDSGANPPRTMVVDINYSDNPWFSQELEEKRAHDALTMDPALYRHIWEGKYYEVSDAQILARKYRVADFEPSESWDGPYYGIDWGFSQDPTAGVKVYIYNGSLYVRNECGKVGLENDDIASFMINGLPDIERHVVYADSARPETINHVKKPNMKDGRSIPRIASVEKWAGSVEDGIAHLQSYKEIIVHPECKEVANEMDLYSYKIDRLSGEVKPDIVDKHNHYIDAIRYALSKIIKRKESSSGMLVPQRLRR